MHHYSSFEFMSEAKVLFVVCSARPFLRPTWFFFLARFIVITSLKILQHNSKSNKSQSSTLVIRASFFILIIRQGFRDLHFTTFSVRLLSVRLLSVSKGNTHIASSQGFFTRAKSIVSLSCQNFHLR